MNNNILKEQIRYYQERAQEYDESIYQTDRFAAETANKGQAEEDDNVTAALSILQTLGPFERILELACGTGIWTKALLKVGNSITALDASSEMLALNRLKIADARVQYQQTNLFTWEPDQQYDLVFFAFWLSHVPPAALDTFFASTARAVRPGGKIFIVDQYAPSQEDLLVVSDDIYATRTLHDGRQFKIVKVFYDVDELQGKLAQLGFDVTVLKNDDIFFFLNGAKSRPASS